MKIVFLDPEALLTDIGAAPHVVLLLTRLSCAAKTTMIHIQCENPVEAAVRLMVVVVLTPEAHPETMNDIIVLLLGLGLV